MDSQPWRNPRPAPSLSEIRAKTSTPRWVAWLWAWWPALVWSGVIFAMSTDPFSSDHTKWFFEPILRWLIPGLAESQYGFVHHIIRKCAHFAEYFVYFLLLYRAVRRKRSGWRWSWGSVALVIAAVYSLGDEFHQTFVASRGPSLYDSLLDTIGASVALVVLWIWFRRHGAVDPARGGE